MKRTNEEIFESILKNGFITKSDLHLLRNRSNKAQKDLFNYIVLEKVNGGYGIPITPEQGAKALVWLKKFIKKNGDSDVYGWREIDIIQNANPSEFTFCGFYDAGRFYRYYLPIYGLGSMEYIPMSTPYIIS